MNVEFLLLTSEKLDQSASHFENILQLVESGAGVRLSSEFRTKTAEEENAESEELFQVIVDHCGMLEEFAFLSVLLLAVRDEKQKMLSQCRITILDEDHRLDIFAVDSGLTAEDEGEDVDISDILQDAIADEFSDLLVG